MRGGGIPTISIGLEPLECPARSAVQETEDGESPSLCPSHGRLAGTPFAIRESRMINKHTYICECCKQTYNSNRSDAEAIKEFHQGINLLGYYDDEEAAIVCDDCFIKIMRTVN